MRGSLPHKPRRACSELVINSGIATQLFHQKPREHLVPHQVRLLRQPQPVVVSQTSNPSAVNSASSRS